MKIRNGFVSNSSSSSFIVFGKSIRFGDITPKLIEAKRIYACHDSDFDGSTDFFVINQKMFDVFMKHGGQLYFYDVDKTICEEGEVSKDDIKTNKFQVFCLDVSQHSVEENDVQTFIERYISMPEVKETKELSADAEKIKFIQEQIDRDGYEAYLDDEGRTKLRKKNENT